MTVISYLIKALQRLMWNILRYDSFLLNGILEKGLKKRVQEQSNFKLTV